MANSTDAEQSGHPPKQSDATPTELQADWDKIERIRQWVVREFSPATSEDSTDPNEAGLFHDELGRKVLRALSHEPSVSRRVRHQPRRPDAELPSDAPQLHGYTNDNDTVRRCNTFAFKLPLPPVAAPEDTQHLYIQPIIPPWKSSSKEWNLFGYHLQAYGSWTRLIDAGVFTEFVLIVLAGEIALKLGRRKYMMKAVRDGQVACLSVWRHSRARGALPTVRLLAGRKAPASAILIGRPRGEVRIKQEAGHDELCSAASATEPPLECQDAELIAEPFNIPIGDAGIEWAKSKPPLRLAGYMHREDLAAGHFSPFQPLVGDTHSRLSTRVFIVHGGAPAEIANYTYHTGTEVIIPLHGKVLVSYAPRNTTGECHRQPRHRLSPETITAEILGEAQLSDGWLRPTVITIDPLEPHGMTTADFQDALCLQIFAQWPCETWQRAASEDVHPGQRSVGRGERA